MMRGYARSAGHPCANGKKQQAQLKRGVRQALRGAEGPQGKGAVSFSAKMALSGLWNGEPLTWELLLQLARARNACRRAT
jgi:hypothetical protein